MSNRTWLPATVIPALLLIAAVGGWYAWTLGRTPEVIDGPAYQSLLARHKGRPIAVFIWADYSPIDRPVLDAFVKLHARYQDDVTFLSLCDVGAQTPDELRASRASVNRRLDRAKVRFPTFLLPGEPDTIFDSLGVHSTPVLLVYDRNGVLLHRFSNDSEWPDLERVLKEAVAAP